MLEIGTVWQMEPFAQLINPSRPIRFPVSHEINVRGRHLRPVFLAVSQGQAAQISVGESASLTEGDAFLGPLVADIRIEPTDESGRARR